MNSSDGFILIKSIIINIEKKINVDSYKYSNIYIWPILRLAIYIYLKKQYNNHQSVSFSQKITAKLKSLLLKFSYKLTNNKNYNLKNLYFGSNSHRILTNGKYENKFFSNENLVVEYDNNLFNLGGNTIPLEKLVKLNKDLRNSRNDLNEIFLKVKEFIPKSVNYNLIKNFCEISLKYYESFQEQLNCPELKKVFILCYYSPSMLGLTIFCKINRINTIEVQHGPISDLHLAYSGWDNCNVKKYQCIQIDIWHEGFKKYVEDTFNEISVEGNYYLKKLKYNKELIKDSILITLQMSDSTLNEIYLHILEEFGDKYKIVIRKHPRQVISSEMNNKIKDLNYRYKNLFFQEGSESINDVLNNSFIHITAHSGTFFEALNFKIPTIFLSQRATEYFHTFIQSKYFINCTNSSKEEITQKIIENAP